MNDLVWYQYLGIGLLFVWSGVVRAGFGFGGAVFALPFLLLILDDPLVFLPIIAVHLLIFSTATVLQNNRKGTGSSLLSLHDSSVDWLYLRKALAIMIVPKMVGVLGLLTLPSMVLSIIIFVIILVYSLSYILNKPFRSNNIYLDYVFLALGGYVSGTSLIGAPLIVAVFSQHVDKSKQRDTLFVLWFILVTIKMGSYLYYGVDLQWFHHLWLLPCALVGHILGLKVHRYLLSVDDVKFYRFLGLVLFLASAAGIVKTLLG